MDDTPPSNIQPLIDWATSHGCTFNSATVVPHGAFPGHGLFNTVSTPADQSDPSRLALFVPDSLIISLRRIHAEYELSDELAEVISAIGDFATLEPTITVFLLWQVYLARKGTPGKWATYVEYLPRKTMLPITWNDAELLFLSNHETTISRPVGGKVAALRKLYDRIRSETGEGWFQSISWEDFILAESWVSSRGIEDPESETPMLVPVFDMANHAASRNCAWEITEHGLELRREPVPIAKDEELNIWYDVERGTGERLHRYGFVADLNPEKCSDSIVFPASLRPKLFLGHIFRIPYSAVQRSFRDLSFLTYENWFVPFMARLTKDYDLVDGPNE
jgi:hypothetical protein